MRSIAELQNQVRSGSQLRITNHEKDSDETFVNMSLYSGIVEYFPEELVVTLKAGTTINEVNQILGENNQALPFYTDNPDKTIGSLYATSGPNFLIAFLEFKSLMAKGSYSILEAK